MKWFLLRNMSFPPLDLNHTTFSKSEVIVNRGNIIFLAIPRISGSVIERQSEESEIPRILIRLDSNHSFFLRQTDIS